MKHKITFLLILILPFKNCLFAQNELLAAQFEGQNELSDANCEEQAIIAAIDTPKIGTDTPAFGKPIATVTTTDTNYIPPERFKTRIPRALVAPGILIVWGVSTIGSHGLFSSRQARTDLLRFTKGKGGPIDDYLIESPYIEFGALLLFKVKCKNDFINTALLIAKSELLMLAITYPMKYIVGEERPYSYYNGKNSQVLNTASLSVRKGDPQAFLSMPSGHSSEAFVAATIVYREYRYLSPWYGIGAYTLATTVAVFRMVNDQHWESDVFVGAGIGMLSANVVYATHKHRWGRNDVCFAPMYDGTNKGFLFSYNF